MTRIINGKRYNTETATELVAWDNGRYGGDFNRCEETLYRTKSGNYFIHGNGGPMSRWACSCGDNSWGGGDGINGLTTAEALEWLEERDEDIPDGCPEIDKLVVDA